MSADTAIHIKHLFISPGHNYFGHHEKPPGENPIIAVPSIHCLAGRGIEGDRFLDYKEDYKGQITFFENEVYEELCAKFGVRDRPPAVLRRNVITVGADLNSLIGREFEIQGVRFLGMAECKPCYWMDRALAPGAEEAMQGRGGLRAKILTDGILRAEGMTKSDSHDPSVAGSPHGMKI
jgi:MOSC domain-containing protein YiiM